MFSTHRALAAVLVLSVISPSHAAAQAAAPVSNAPIERPAALQTGAARPHGIVGIRAGWNYGTLATTIVPAQEPPVMHSTTWSSRPGPSLGLFARTAHRRIAVQMELLLITDRGELTARDVSGVPVFGSGVSQTYLDVPVLFVVPLAAFGGVRLNAFAGPVVAVCVSLNEEEKTPTMRLATTSAKRIDAGVILGASVELQRFVLDGRYSMGFRQIDRFDYPTRGAIDASRRSLSLTLGWRFK